jgi:hypothetical protein
MSDLGQAEVNHHSASFSGDLCLMLIAWSLPEDLLHVKDFIDRLALVFDGLILQLSHLSDSIRRLGAIDGFSLSVAEFF